MVLDKFTPEQQLARVWDVEAVKTLMYKRMYMQTADLRKDELATIWVSDPANQATASYGSNWGYYVGMDAIRGYYLDAHNAELAAQQQKNGAAEANLGNMYIHPLSTGLVELAQDGRTAKGLWYSFGHESKALADGTSDVRWMLGKIAADFIKEADGWKLWHLIVSTDVDCQAGHDWAEYPVYVNWGADSDNPVRKEFGTPTIEMMTHDVTFNWWDDYPGMPPKDYKTFSDSISYGPEGYQPPAVPGLHAGEGRNWK